MAEIDADALAPPAPGRDTIVAKRLVAICGVHLAFLAVAFPFDLANRHGAATRLALVYGLQALGAVCTALVARREPHPPADRLTVAYTALVVASLVLYAMVIAVDPHAVAVALAVVVMGAPVYFGWSPERAVVLGVACLGPFFALTFRDGAGELNRWALMALVGATAIAVINTRALSRMQADVDRRERDLATLSMRLMTMQEEERRRLSRELHDGLGQSLTALLSYFWLLERQLPEEWVELRTHTEEARRLAARTLADLRELSHLLRPPALDDFGLVPSLETHLRGFAEQHRIAATFTARGLPERLPAPLETAVYRITQEALANVARHAKATRVGVLLAAEHGGLTLTIEDDGVGFPDPKQHARNGNGAGGGLIGIRERVRALGGRVSFTSEHGARIRVELPVLAA